MTTDKLCTKCKALKPRSEFYKQTGLRDSLSCWCKACNIAGTTAAAKKRRSTPEGVAAFRNVELRREYGITLADYNRLFAEQAGRCAICGSEKPGRPGWTALLVVDHDHINGRVRGLLCSRCNSGVGYFWDDPTLLEKAAGYVRNSRRLRAVS